MKRALFLAIFAMLTLQARAATYYVIVAGLGGEPDYEQRFTTAANDLDKVFKASSDISPRLLPSPAPNPRRRKCATR